MASGMESPSLAIAESKHSRKPRKILDHIRVSRSLEGGHVIEHHFTSYQHEPEPHKFGPGRKADARAHLLRHTGLHEDGAEAEKLEEEE